MKKITLDSLVLHDLSTNNDFMVSPPIEGLEFPEIRTSSFPRSGQDGVYVTNQFLGQRVITLQGTLKASDYRTQRKVFLAELKPTKVNEVLQQKVLKLIDLDNNEYRINVQVQSAKMNLENVDFANWMVNLIALDNAISSESTTAVSVSTLTGGGYIYPVIYPIVTVAGTGSVVTASNLGDVETFPTVTFTGPLTNPRLENTTTGKFIALTLSILSGETVVIDMLNRTIVQGAVTNRLNTMSEDSDFWSLVAGDNVLRLVTSVNGETGTATTTFRDQYVGL